MKNILIIPVIIFSYLLSAGQGVGINETGVAADPSAMLDVKSTTKGMLIPRMRTIERTAIPSPAEGLLVYDIDTYSFWYHNLGLWKEIMKDGDGFSLPYDGTGVDPDKLFSITNTSAASSTAIFGRRLGGSGLGLSMSNAVWGDNLDGNGVAGTSDSNNGVAGFSNSGYGVSATSISGAGLYANSTTGFGISSISQTNFGLASTSNGVDKPGVLGVNTNNSGVGYGVIGLIENPTGGAGVWGKNNAPAGNAGLFTNVNNSNVDPALKVTTSGNGAAGYFSALGLGPSGYFVHNNASNPNPGLLVSNSSIGVGLAVWQNASNTNHGIQVLHLGSGKGIYSKSEMGQAGLFELSNAANTSTSLKSTTAGTGLAGLFEITNTANDAASLKATTIGTGLAGHFVKNNTTGSTSDIHDPAVFIDNNSKGAALKIISLHSPSANCAIDVNYGGDAVGINVNSIKTGIHSITQTAAAYAMVGENYSGGSGIKGVGSHWTAAGVVGENTNDGGAGVLGIGTGPTGIGVKGVSVSANYAEGAVTGINNAPNVGIGVYGEATGTAGMGVYGICSGTNGAIRGENTGGGPGIHGESTGAYATGVFAWAHSTPGTHGNGVLGQNFGEGDGVRGYSGTNGAGVFGKSDSNGTGIIGTTGSTNSEGSAAYFSVQNANNNNIAVRINSSGAGGSLEVKNTNPNNSVTQFRVTKSGTGDYAVFEEGDGDNEIRFDNNGKGFFNGGTQTGGADIAESFEVEDDIQNYEPGDVLIISLDKDRTVVKSSRPYSNLVAGVFATKPGVLMTEEHIDADLSGQVPMGVIGVIPTKVCLEGGKISRGDMLVTSSITGVAMKADPDKVKLGQVLGKALENYSLDDVGLIKVLVNVK